MNAQIETPEMKKKRSSTLEEEVKISSKHISREIKGKDLDTVLIAVFQKVTPYKWNCKKCGRSFFRKRFQEKLQELLKTENSEGENHLLYQLDRASELAYWICPGCKNPVDFSTGGSY
jgi:rubrerythrin